MAASNPQAERASTYITVRVRVDVGLRGKPTVEVLSSHIDTATLTRPWRKAELEAGQEDPWFEGGAAILDPTHASNGRAMVAKVIDAADAMRLKLIAAAK